MKKLMQDVQVVTKEFDRLTKKTKKLTDELIKMAAYQLEKARTAMKPEVAAKRAASALRTMTKTMEKITKALEKFEKDQTVRKRKPRAKTKVSKKAPVKRKTSAKKRAAPTATDRVLAVIKRSKKGVDVPTLMKKTGFDETKARNIVSRAFRQGKIKRVGRGVYVGA